MRQEKDSLVVSTSGKNDAEHNKSLQLSPKMRRGSLDAAWQSCSAWLMRRGN